MKKIFLTEKEITENADNKKLDLKNTKCNFDIYFKQGKISDLQIQLDFCNKKYHNDKIKYIESEIKKELKNTISEIEEETNLIKVLHIYEEEKTENQEFEEVLEAYQYFKGENI